MTIAPQNNLVSIQALRAIAALAVLVCHIGSIEGKYMHFRLLPEWGMYGVDIFFVISGFIITYTAGNVTPTLKGVGRFLLKRALRIYPVYWQCTAVVLVMMLVRPEWVNLASAEHPPSVVSSLLLWPQMMDPHLGVGWALVYEFYFYLMFALGMLLLRGKLIYGWVVWVLALSICTSFNIHDTTQVAEIKLITSPYTFHFLIGCAAAWCYQRGYTPAPVTLLMTSVAWALVGFAVAYNAYGTVVYYHQEMLRVVVVGVPAAMLMLGLLLRERIHKTAYPGWLIKVGDASYSLYLLHTLLISAMGKVWVLLKYESALLHVAYVVFMAVIAIVLALLNYRWFEKPFTDWYRRKLA